MKKFCFIYFICISQFVFANVEKKENEKKEINKKVYLAFKPAYFHPQDRVYRNVYGGGYISLGEINCKLYKSLYLWLESGFLNKTNTINRLGSRYNVEVEQIPISFGLNYLFPRFCRTNIYLKIGPNWLFTRTVDDLPSVGTVNKKWSFGATFGTGAKIHCTSDMFLDVFLNYLYNRKKIQNSNTEFIRYLGGLQVGAGIGWMF